MKLLRKLSKKYYFRGAIAYLLTWCMLFNTSVVLASPVDPLVENGTINAVGNTHNLGTNSNLYTADGTIIKWQEGFDIANGESVQFHQYDIDVGGVLDPDSAVLNRILTGSQTVIDGLLSGNGRVFVVNPAGVIFSANAQVNVAQLVASSLDIDNGAFIAGNYDFIVGDGVGEVINRGTITADDGGDLNVDEGVALLGQRVLNTGTITTANPGGFVVMAAGDRVLLGEPGSKIIVEMSSATGGIEGVGEVTNEYVSEDEPGNIESPGGQIVLAAGDIFSLGTALDTEPVKVLFGSGSVEQSGTIRANGTTGDGGTVTLTAAETTTLSSGSVTTANAGTGGDSGRVTVHSADTAIVQSGAQIEATGGYTPEQIEDSLAPLYLITENSVEIIGDTINFAGSIDASATDITKKGKIWIEADSLTIANGSLPVEPADNTLYETWIEGQSNANVDLELVAHSSDNGTITVDDLGDELTLYGGDLALLTTFNIGGIDFGINPATVHSTAGGNIFVATGAGGISVGHIISDVTNGSGNPGRVRLLTSNGGTINTGSLYVHDGSIVEISVIASGGLFVDGGVVAKTNQVPADDQTIGFARICLVSETGSVEVDGTNAINGQGGGKLNAVAVSAHGKIKANADVRICAGEDVDVHDMRSHDVVEAFSQVSATNPLNKVDSKVKIGAGGLLEEAPDPLVGTISINGETNIDDLEVLAEAKASSGPSMQITPADDEDSNPDTVTADDDDGLRSAALLINKDFAERLPDDPPCEDCPCVDCPKPPDFASEVFAVDDFAEEHMDTIVDETIEDETTVFWNDVGVTDILAWSPTGFGILTINKDTGEFEYTPLPGYVGTVTSTYLATDGKTTDTALLTITLTNTLPSGDVTLSDAHMDTTGDTLSKVSGEFTDSDDAFSIESILKATDDDNFGFGGTVTYNGSDDPYVTGDTYDYTADTTLPGYVGDDDFDVKLWDGQRDYVFDTSGAVVSDDKVLGDGTIALTLINTLPSGAVELEDAHMNASGQTLGTVSGEFTDVDDEFFAILNIKKATDDDNKTFGGTIAEYSGFQQYDYTADPLLPGYVGEDDFDVDLWDGQVDYAFKLVDDVWVIDYENSVNVYGSGTIDLTVTNTVPSGAVVLEDGHMNAVGQELAAVGGDFTDGDGDDFAIDSIVPATDDENKTYGGSLAYNGSDDPYVSGGTYDYTADGTLPGYTGEDDFDVQLWDGENSYVFTFVDEDWVATPTPEYGTGTIDLTVTNTSPSGAVILEDAHMNASGEELSVVSGDFTDPDNDPFEIIFIHPATDDENKTFGGALAYNGSDDPYVSGDTYDYTADPLLPGYTGEDDFVVILWDGQRDFTFVEVNGEWVAELVDHVSSSGTIDLEVTNTLPSGAVVLEDAHMNASGETLNVIIGDFTDADDDFAITSITAATGDENKTFGGTLAYNGSDDPYVSGDTYDYTADGALPGYVGEDDFDVQLWDGENSYVFTFVDEDWVATPTPEYGTGTIDLTVTNTLPTAGGDLGETAPGMTLFVPQTDTTSPVFVSDPEPDTLSIIQAITPDHYTGSAGGKLEFDGSQWIYTPASGHTGPEEFIVNVSDGQNNYVFTFVDAQWTATPTPEHGAGTVSVLVSEEPPPPPPPTFVPPAPLLVELPEIEGCPVLLEVVALELGITGEDIQVSIGGALALNPNIQPCEACARITDYAAILRDTDGLGMAAMVQVFNELAPAEQPFDDVMGTSIVTAFAGRINDIDMPQYATAMEYINAFVGYVVVLDTELGSPVGDSTVFVMEKHGTAVTESDNPNIAAYIAAQLEALGN